MNGYKTTLLAWALLTLVLTLLKIGKPAEPKTGLDGACAAVELALVAWLVVLA